MRILIIDDDTSRSETIKAWLIHEGLSTEEDIVSRACTSKSRTEVKNNFYDVLILDVVLPKRDGDSKSVWTNGIDLLKYINESPLAKKPSKIIGITAYSEDIQNFKSEFEKYCFTVVEVVDGNDAWKEMFRRVFNYQSSSKIASLDSEKPIIAFTVHGIRTFGNWQEKLCNLIRNKASYIDYQTYKYGYFWGVNFFLPFMRNIQVRRLKRRLIKLFKSHPDKKFVCYAHSFGTFLIVKAIDDLIISGCSVPPLKIVLAGSVLPSYYKFDNILDYDKNNIIINDCGNNDYVLLLSEAFVLSTGMAGRTGFYGINDKRLINRFHPGNHSHYFEVDGFMEKYWLPVLWDETVVGDSNTRPYKIIEHGLLEQLVVLSCKIKLSYPFIAAFLLYKAFIG